METSPILTAESLSVGYNRNALLSGLDLQLLRGKTVALVGGNGIGKSTLLRTLTGELKPVGGTVRIAGVPLQEWNRRRLARTLAIVTTDREADPAWTVSDLVRLGRDPHTGFLGRLSSADRDAVDKAIADMRIEDKATKRLGTLSDGERQKAFIARALAQDAELIVLDEPFSFLDPGARVETLALLTSLAKRDDKAILFSSHDVAQALRMAETLWMITPDRRFISGTPASLKASGEIENLFDNRSVRFDPAQNDFVENSI